ncbi:MAG: hypothetical protein ACI9J2_000957 [Saprospiraceae bacterium]|jgi:hypothetical protein
MNWLNSKERLSAVWAMLTAILLLASSFIGTDAEVYLFPRIAAVCIAVLAVVLVYTNIRITPTAEQVSEQIFDWQALLPGLIVGVIYIICIEYVGFYASSFIAFCAITMLYGKRSTFDGRALLYKFSVAAIFLMVLYILFWKLLHVRTPTGLLF